MLLVDPLVWSDHLRRDDAALARLLEASVEFGFQVASAALPEGMYAEVSARASGRAGVLCFVSAGTRQGRP